MTGKRKTSDEDRLVSPEGLESSLRDSGAGAARAAKRVKEVSEDGNIAQRDHDSPSREAAQGPPLDSTWEMVGYSPQSPRYPSMEKAIEEALEHARRDKISSTRETYLPPGFEVQLPDFMKDKIIAKVKADYQNPVVAFNKKKRFMKSMEEARKEYVGFGSNSRTRFVHESTPEDDRTTSSVTSSPGPNSRESRLGATNPKPPSDTAKPASSIHDFEAPSTRARKPSTDIGHGIRQSSISHTPQTESHERIEKRLKSAPKPERAWDRDTASSVNPHGPEVRNKAHNTQGLGQNRIGSGHASRTQAQGPSPTRSVHLHNRTDVRDLLRLVQAEKNAIRRDAAGNSVDSQRRIGKLGWVLTLLGKQYAVLKRITHPSFRRRSDKLPDLLEHKVTKAFPFGLPVRVNLVHVTGRLSREHIEKICDAFDLTTHRGVRDCIAWLEYQLAELKTSPLHYQPQQRYGPTESAFLQETSYLLDAMRARLRQVPPPPPPPLPAGFTPRTPKRVRNGGGKTAASESDGDWSPKSPSYSPRSAAASTHSSVSSPLTENGRADANPSEDIAGDWDDIEPFSPLSPSISMNEVVSKEFKAAPMAGRMNKILEELDLPAPGGRAEEKTVQDRGEGQSKDGMESTKTEKGQGQECEAGEGAKAYVRAGEEDELEEGEVVEE